MSTAKNLSWRGKALMAIVSPLVVFGLLEVALRIAGYRFEPWKKHLEGHTYTELRQREIYVPHPTLLWTPRPSSILDFPELGFRRIHTNSLGLRGEEFHGPKGPDEIRVLCLGDSITFCLGLPDGKTWPDQMERALRAAPEMRGKTVRVMNGAVPGWSSVQGMRLFDRLAGLEPDVVVFWFGLADSHEMRDLPDSAQILPVRGLPGKLALLWKLRVFQLVQQVVTGVRRAAAEGTRVSRAEFRANVERLRELDRTGGPRAIFVREPERCEVTMAQLTRVVARAEEEDVEYVLGPHRLLSWIIPAPDGADLTGRLVEYQGRSALLFAPDPSKAGYGKANEAMSVADVRRDLHTLRELKRSLDGILAGLPRDALDYADLFGNARPDDVFKDNCHLTPRGARLAGEAIAKRIRRQDHSCKERTNCSGSSVH